VWQRVFGELQKRRNSNSARKKNQTVRSMLQHWPHCNTSPQKPRWHTFRNSS